MTHIVPLAGYTNTTRTLRDEFAMAALAKFSYVDQFIAATLAERAYLVADAMLAERIKEG